jgi:hypothetical protein
MTRDERLRDAQKRYESTDKGRLRKKKYRQSESCREIEREFDFDRNQTAQRREYRRTWMRQRRAQLKQQAQQEAS